MGRAELTAVSSVPLDPLTAGRRPEVPSGGRWGVVPDAPGRVPWWRAGRQDVTLQRIIVHVIYDLARHAGQADIMREQHDRAIGELPENSNIPEAYDWPAYVARLNELADEFT